MEKKKLDSYKRTTVVLPMQLLIEAKTLAAHMDTSLSKLIRVALREKIESIIGENREE